MANDVYQSKYTAVQIEQKLDDVGSLKTENSTQNDLISSLSTSTSELESVASSLSNENSTQNSHLNSLSTENSTQTSEIISLSTTESELSSEVEMLNSEVAEKQDSLTAGDNITITNNVISATGGGHKIQNEGDLEPLTQRKTMLLNEPLVASDDAEGDNTVVDVDTDVDLSVIHAPGQRTPDEFEVAITDPQEGQVMKYNATTEQWENGEIDTKHTYSTNEHVVGTWIDGKPVYEKTISGGNFSANGNFVVNHNISNLDEVVYVSNPIWHDTTDDNWGAQARLYFSGSVSSSYAIGGRVVITNTELRIQNESGFAAVNWSGRTEKIRITIQYTKTTDTV